MTVRPLATFTGCLLIWGTTWIVIRHGIEDLPPLGNAALRLAIAGVVLLAVALASGVERPTRRGAWSAVLVGLFLFGGNMGLIYVAEKSLTSSMTVILYSTMPLQAALLSPLLLKHERWTWPSVAGAVLGFVGVAISYQGIQQIDRTLAMPAVIAVLAATMAAIGTALARRHRSVHPLWTNAIGNLAATVALAVISLVLERQSPIPHSRVGWLSLFYLAFFGSIAAFVLYTDLLRHWNAARASYVTIGAYSLATVIGVVLAGEPVTASLLGGGAVILAGAALSLKPDGVRLGVRSVLRQRRKSNVPDQATKHPREQHGGEARAK